jgi:parvulin-like peptidyl-prolyl isomerase
MTRMPGLSRKFACLLALLFAGPALAVPALAAPSAAKAADDPVLATVGEVTITAADLRQEMARRGGSRPDAYATAESRRLLLDELVEARLRVEAARAAGYENDPEIQRALELLMAAKLERDQLEPQFAELEVSDDEVAARYQAQPELYTTAEQVRVALIRLDAGRAEAGRAEADRAQADTAQAAILAESAAIDPAQGFGDLARRYSDDGASRYVGGVVGWLVRGDRYRWPAEVVEAAFAQNAPGEVAVVETDQVRYFVRRMERRPSSLRPLAAVADGIRRELQRQQRDAARVAFYQQLRRQFSVEVDAAAAELIAPPVAHQVPPSVPGH